MFPTSIFMMADAEDHVWLLRSDGLGTSTPMMYPRGGMERFRQSTSIWDVFTPDGVWLGTLRLPPERAPRQIGEDFILLAGEDDAGVSRVWLHALERGG